MKRVKDRNSVLVSQICCLSGQVYGTGWKKTVIKPAWHSGAHTSPSALTWVAEKGPRTLLQSPFRDAVGAVEQLFLFNPQLWD